MDKIAAQAHIGAVAIRVKNLQNMVNFYKGILGLDVKSQSNTRVELGAQETNQTILILEKVADEDDAKMNPQTTGLYHMAFLLPERGDLGNMLIRLLQVEYPLIGASDHGYSEALYLNDPEGNGIEIYRDKPMSEWKIHEDGRIDGITIQMDAEGVVAAADRNFRGMVPGTTMGHVHLKVADLEKTSHFYEDIIGMSRKAEGYGALFLAAGTYHHHIGANTWDEGASRLPAKQDDLGLDYFEIVLPDAASMAEVKERLMKEQYDFELLARGISAVDPNGIVVHLVEKAA